MKRRKRSCKQFACRTAFLFFSSKFRGATACTGKASRLMRMQGKTPKGLRARQQCAHSASRTGRPVADQTWPPFSRKAGKPRHPLWLSRRFDEAMRGNSRFKDDVFLRQHAFGGTLFYCVVSLYCIAFSAKVLFTITSCGAVFSSSPAAVITVCSKSKLSCVSTGSVLYAPMSL